MRVRCAVAPVIPLLPVALLFVLAVCCLLRCRVCFPILVLSILFLHSVLVALDRVKYRLLVSL